VIATAADIDDQKRAEDALRKAIVLRDDFLSVACTNCARR
jgi:hypothetical protein